MKYFFSFLFLFSFAMGPMAQITSARVTYQESTTLDLGKRKDIEPGMQALLSQLPEQFTVTSELLFSEQAATYVKKPVETDDFSAEQGNTKITFKISESDPDVFYVDLTSNTTLQKRSIFGKDFQIKDEVAAIDWTIMDKAETDAVSTLPVQKAVGITAEGDTLTAWYTTSVPVSTGPKTFGGLPGLIVKLIDGKTTYQLTKIDILAEAPEIPLPFEGGKTITLEKYNEIEDKKMKALESSNGTRVMTFGGE